MANRVLLGNRSSGGYGLYVSKDGENVLTADNSNNLGIGSLTPDRKFDVGSGDLIVGAAITIVHSLLTVSNNNGAKNAKCIAFTAVDIVLPTCLPDLYTINLSW